MERIDKVISNQMCISRSDARRLIKIGKVYINNERIKAFDTKVDENSLITVNGQSLQFCQKVYIMMNKAQGIVCDDKGKFPYAPDVLPSRLISVFFCIREIYVAEKINRGISITARAVKKRVLVIFAVKLIIKSSPLSIIFN